MINEQTINTDYKVGYKKPPKGVEWQPGESGNPAGRPVDSLTTLLKEYLDANNQGEKRKIIAELVNIAKSTGVQGQIAALREIFDRVDGKVSQDITVAALVAPVTQETLELARERLLEAKTRSKQLVEEHKEPQVLINEDKGPSTSENED